MAAKKKIRKPKKSAKKALKRVVKKAPARKLLDKQALEVFFEDFLKKNPTVKVNERKAGEFELTRLWNDDSFTLSIPTNKLELDDLKANLKEICLPYSFSAIYHKSSNKLEFVFTVFSEKTRWQGRSFNFAFVGETFKCSYGPSSKVLLCIARNLNPIFSTTATNYRGLLEYNFFLQSKTPKSGKVKKRNLKPVSFWIEGIKEWDNVKMISLAKHINFYMRYFDRLTPTINIHDEQIETATKTFTGLFDSFPKEIRAHRMDPTILDLSATAYKNVNPFLKFLYLYQVIEYAAFYFRPEEIDQKLRRILLAPHTGSHLNSAMNEIMELVASTKGDNTDDAKFDALVKYYADPKLIWKAIEHHKAYFSTGHTFDGGIQVDQLINKDWEYSDFLLTAETLGPKFRKIRNSIVHARDKRNPSAISPTTANSDRLRPWIDLLSIISNQILIDPVKEPS